jgi:CHRD domain
MFVTHAARRVWWVAIAVLAALGLVLMVNGPALGSAQSVPSVKPTPAEEVPPVTDAKAFGGLFFWEIKGESLVADLSGNTVEDLTAAHLHLGAKGANGPVVVTLFSNADGVRDFHVTPTITAKDLAGPLAGKTWADFLKELQAGNIYVNIHSKQHPAGIARAQIPASVPSAPRSGSGLESADSNWLNSTSLGAVLIAVAGGAVVLTVARGRRRA